MIISTSGIYSYLFLGQTLHLLPQRAIYWEETKTLLIADVHLGKVNHFRKAGIAIPDVVSKTDYQVLNTILQTYPVSRVLILGDLFHSTFNDACLTFAAWIKEYPHIEFILVKGNHDVLPDSFYALTSLKIYSDTFVEYPFIFSHIPLTDESTCYNLSGHIHPAVKLTGKARQQLVLPCFYFGRKNGILPAFSTFTGKATLNPLEEDVVFIIGKESVIPVTPIV